MSDPDAPPERDAQAAFEREFARLRENYRTRLRGELADLGETLGAARVSRSSGPGLEDARRRVHRLKGTAGSYGLDATFTALERLEAQLDRLRAAAPAEAAPLWADAARALQRARAALD